MGNIMTTVLCWKQKEHWTVYPVDAYDWNTILNGKALWHNVCLMEVLQQSAKENA